MKKFKICIKKKHILTFKKKITTGRYKAAIKS